mgnify:CR=1 FL=1
MKLLPDAQRGALAFALCRTQWQHAPSGRPTGLRYEGCMTVLRMQRERHGIARADLGDWFSDLQVMEAAFVQGVSEVMKAEADASQHAIPPGGRPRHA